MKILILMRHGEAGSPPGTNRDILRPLTEYGKQQSRKAAEILAGTGVKPELTITSEAVRAKATARIVKEWIAPETKTTVSEALYDSDSYRYSLTIKSLPDTVDTVLMVGHNPSAAGLISTIADQPVRFGTADICILTFNSEQWKDVFSSIAEIKFLRDG